MIKIKNTISVGHILSISIVVVGFIYTMAQQQITIERLDKLSEQMNTKVNALEITQAVLKQDFITTKDKCMKVEKKCYKIERDLLVTKTKIQHEN